MLRVLKGTPLSSPIFPTLRSQFLLGHEKAIHTVSLGSLLRVQNHRITAECNVTNDPYSLGWNCHPRPQLSKVENFCLETMEGDVLQQTLCCSAFASRPPTRRAALQDSPCAHKGRRVGGGPRGLPKVTQTLCCHQTEWSPGHS